MVFVVGETETAPEVAPPVEKLVPVQEVVSVDDHETVEEEPRLIGFAESATDAVGVGGAETVHELYVYEPESEPLLHERDCETQDWPYGTVDA